MASPLLSVGPLSKAFASVQAVDGVAFDVRAGEIFGFLGPNGAGKTTTLRMIMRIIRPDSGEVRFEGRADLDRARVGYLPEERGLLEDGEVIDTLVYLGTLRGMSARDARAAGLRWLDRLGLADRVTAKVGTLSKGNQQKVQFAGAVMHRPALAVLDEPFSGLDPLNQELFLALIQELKSEGAGVLLSAHHLNLAERLCDRLLLIARGRPVLEGTLSEIRRRAAGGAGEVLRMRVRGGSGDAAAIAARVRAAMAGATCEATPAEGGALDVTAYVPAGADLAPAFAALPGLAIDRVEMHALSLHEIYVRAVGGAADKAVPEATGV